MLGAALGGEPVLSEFVKSYIDPGGNEAHKDRQKPGDIEGAVLIWTLVVTS
jgi:hypothetical protein